MSSSGFGLVSLGITSSGSDVVYGGVGLRGGVGSEVSGVFTAWW
jgi:hypothetical protein